MQAIHVVSQFHIYWPPLPMYGLRALAIFNFSLEMLPWTCYGIPMLWWVGMWVGVWVCCARARRVCVCVYACRHGICPRTCNGVSGVVKP